MNAKIDRLAREFDFNNMIIMAERGVIPQKSHVLGIGAMMATLGQEIAFFRQDIHWTNIAPEYDDPDILPLVNQGPDGNTEYYAKDLDEIPTLFDAKTFDRIFCHADDILHLDEARIQKLGQAIVHVLDDKGIAKIARVPKSRIFIDNATYSKFSNVMTFRA